MGWPSGPPPPSQPTVSACSSTSMVSTGWIIVLVLGRRRPGTGRQGARRAAPRPALNAIDLDIPRGSLFGLLGPNGAGKSTLINILAGLVVKTSGTACLWGIDIDEHPRQARAAIGVVPQEL